MIKDKMIQMATKLGMSPETIKSMESDTMSTTPSTSSVTVAVVKPESSDTTTEDKVMEECAKFTDEQIDKMSEQEAKDYLKKVRDAAKADMESDKTETPAPKPVNRIMDAKIM